MSGVDIYRIKIARKSDSCSRGNWQIVEGRSEMEHKLFPLAAEAMAHTDSWHVGRRERGRSWRWREWWKQNILRDEDDYPSVYRIVAVEERVDSEWVAMQWRLTDPVLSVWSASEEEQDKE